MTGPALPDAVATPEGTDVELLAVPDALATSLPPGLELCGEQPVRASAPVSSRQPSTAARRRAPDRSARRVSARTTGAPPSQPDSTRRKPTRRQYREDHKHARRSSPEARLSAPPTMEGCARAGPLHRQGHVTRTGAGLPPPYVRTAPGRGRTFSDGVERPQRRQPGTAGYHRTFKPDSFPIRCLCTSPTRWQQRPPGGSRGLAAPQQLGHLSVTVH